MKKHLTKIIILLISLLTISCSNDDNSSQPDIVEYTTINILGESYTDYPYATSSTVAPSCNSNIDLSVQQFGDFINAQFDIWIVFIYRSYQYQFEEYDISNTVIKQEYNPLSSCYNNFDFIVEYYDNENDEKLNLDNSFTNMNTIESINKIDEDSNEITYAVKGSFSLRFNKGGNTLIPVTGDYNRFIYVQK
ncbi:hypothetical protein GCM10007424_01350 [Flavobacterium suaedae]|uniref:Lipoprotein n=1 Tax=Flavobacterium suaedae TaxID=1767027 RepID=A0ABQ1JEH7_9FLAO|nr:hypothetical protein [Flavobacterium suaedae]GGB65169.1 hypothetical protein GCM10007424_01350 [Flavobacterium suaedae]